MKEITLTNTDLVAVIDDSDFELISDYSWYMTYSSLGQTPYAVTKVNGKFILMHRFILGAGRCQLVDHVNGDGLDNRRKNIRLANKSQNMANSRLGARNKSGYKGVSWDQAKARWVTSIYSKGKYFYLGRFDDRIQAAKAYDAKAKELFGEFAKLNF